MEKGSIFVLTLFAVLILSVMVAGLMTLGLTEIQTTQNYLLSKDAYYVAVNGVEEIRKRIADNPDFEAVQQISISASSTTYSGGGVDRSYITGTLKDMEDGGSGSTIKSIGNFQLPFFSGFNLAVTSGIPRMGLWKLNVTSRISAPGSKYRFSYAEVSAGIVGPFATEAYH